MTAQDFLAWMEQTGTRFAGDFATKVGLSVQKAQEMVAAAKRGEDVVVRQTVALAMTAVAMGLKPWDEYRRK